MITPFSIQKYEVIFCYLYHYIFDDRDLIRLQYSYNSFSWPIAPLYPYSDPKIIVKWIFIGQPVINYHPHLFNLFLDTSYLLTQYFKHSDKSAWNIFYHAICLSSCDILTMLSDLCQSDYCLSFWISSPW